MIYYLTYTILAWSLTDLLIGSYIFERPRNYISVKIPFIGKMLSCMQCSGFWVGVILGILSFAVQTPVSLFIPEYGITLWFFNGVFVSGSSVLINTVIYRLSQ